ncbi:unnamed protein product, partial [Choristocarpus tenellus]
MDIKRPLGCLGVLLAYAVTMFYLETIVERLAHHRGPRVDVAFFNQHSTGGVSSPSRGHNWDSSCISGTFQCPCIELTSGVGCLDNLVCDVQNSLCELDPLWRNFSTRAVGKKQPPVCNLHYAPRTSTPQTASVIMSFYNESAANLERSVMTLLERTNWDALLDIILVDDGNAAVEGSPVWSMPKVRLVRTKQREGIMRARMIGSRYARGEVLVFFDAHIEVQEGWLEPLVGTIRNNYRTIAVPTLDVIMTDSVKTHSG